MVSSASSRPPSTLSFLFWAPILITARVFLTLEGKLQGHGEGVTVIITLSLTYSLSKYLDIRTQWSVSKSYLHVTYESKSVWHLRERNKKWYTAWTVKFVLNVCICKFSIWVPIYFSKKSEIKFIYAEKATKFCKIFPLLLTTVHTVKSYVKISHNFVAFSEYMNFNFFRKY